MATNNNWNNQIAAANSVITLNSGTNTISTSSDASATTINIARIKMRGNNFEGLIYGH